MQHISYTDMIQPAIQQLAQGRALLTVGGDKPNTMTIAWGSIGYCWNRPVFTVYVRPQRHTHDILQTQGRFTVSISLNNEPTDIFRFAGNTSGKDIDKFDGHGITAAAGQKIDCPVIGECQLHFECILRAAAPMTGEAMHEETRRRVYPEADYHTIYMGEIVDCYRTDI